MHKRALELLILVVLFMASTGLHSAAQVMLPDVLAKADMEQERAYALARESMSPAALSAIQVAAGGSHTCALTNLGTVMCWGAGSADSRAPVVVGELSNVKAIAAGSYHDCALLATGGVKCWGNNSDGQLGDGSKEFHRTPVSVIGLGSGVIAIAAGERHTCALTRWGDVKCWGNNSDGQLGDGTANGALIPVNSLISNVSAITTGDRHTCAVTRSSAAKCWGDNHYGQLGDGTAQDRYTPVDVRGLQSGVTAMAASTGHTCAVLSGGDARCWGFNSSGQLGTGIIGGPDACFGFPGMCSFTPMEVRELGSGLKAITVGIGYVGAFGYTAAHSCALTDTGGIKCWGDNQNGQLGDGTTQGRPAPVSVVGLNSGIASIAAGQAHSCAATIGGRVKCWGRNVEGQVGPGGAFIANPSPVDVPGFEDGQIDAAAMVSQSEYPTVAPGQSVSYRVTVRNSGTTTWRVSDGYGWRGDDEWLGDSGPVTGETPPGGIWRFERTFNAPATPGEYVYGFMLRHGAQEFGPYFFVRVTVRQPAVTEFRPNPNGLQVANTTLFLRDWAMFRQAFGAANVETADGKPCPAAEAFFTNQYERVAEGWSCVGFSAASMISFLGKAQPNTGQYAMPAYPRLYDQQWSTTLSVPIAYYAGTQKFKQFADEYGDWLRSCDQDPGGVVERVKQNVEAGEPLLLSLPWGKGSHAVTPYSVVYTSASEAQVFVYDSEAPGDNTKSVRFTFSGNQWQWNYMFVGSIASAGTKSGGCKDMYAFKLSTLLEQGQPMENWCAQGAVASSFDTSETSRAQAATGRMLIALPSEGNVVIRDAQGRRLGWIAGQHVSEITDALYLPEMTAPGLSTSLSFYLPAGAYTLEADEQPNAVVDTTAFGDGRVIMLQSKASGMTSLQVSADLAQAVIANPAAFSSLNATLIEAAPDGGTVAVVSATQATGTAPLTLRSNGNQFGLERDAGSLNYTLSYRNSGALDFVSPQVTLGANDSHTISYNGSTAMLQIDRGRDGTIDETRTLTNEVRRVYLPVIKR